MNQFMTICLSVCLGAGVVILLALAYSIVRDIITDRY